MSIWLFLSILVKNTHMDLVSTKLRQHNWELSVRTWHIVRAARTKRVVRYLVLALSSIVLMSAHAFEIRDFAIHVTLSDPQISPDEKRVAYVRMSANQEFQYQYEIVLKELSGTERKVLTRKNQFAHSPQWISNRELSFLALTKQSGHQVFVLNLDDGQLRQVSHYSASVQGYSWSPNRMYLAYAVRPKPKPSLVKAFQVTKYSLSPPKPSQVLYLLNVNTGENKKLPGTLPLVDRWSRISWAPDGLSILYTRKNTQHYDEYANYLSEFDLLTGEERTLGVGGYPQYSPDGNKILFQKRETADYPFSPRKAYILNRLTEEIQRVAPALDREVLGRYTPDGHVLLNGPDIHTQRLWITNAGAVKQLTLDGIEPTWPLHASQSKSTLVFVGVSASLFQELYAYTDGKIRRITDENSTLLQNRSRGTTQSLEWVSSDGVQIVGIRLFPPDFQKNKRYPLVVIPHGGPHTSSTVASVANNLVNQTMAHKGWIVLSPNFRGSTNQGREFHLFRARNPSYDRDVIKDVMAGITALNEKCECIDMDRKAILGTSYGGKVAAWATALHPTAWVSSVVGSAVLDDFDMYARSDRGMEFPKIFGGYPWRYEFSDEFLRASPIYSAEQITTPTLILSTLRDSRVPVTQSFKFWRALEDNGVEVEFIAYEMSGHGPSDLTNSIDYWKRAVDWIANHFEQTPASASAVEK